MEKNYKAIFVESPKQKGVFVLPKSNYFQILKCVPKGNNIESYLLNEIRKLKVYGISHLKDIEKYFLDISDYSFSKWTPVKGKNNIPIKDNKSWNNHISAAYANLVVDTSELIAKINNSESNSDYYVEATQVLKEFENKLNI